MQHDAVDDLLTGRQNLEMFGRLHHLRPRAARRRAGELLEQFGLVEAGDRLAKTYSGGMRRRLDLAAGFILAPQVLFLDEPTTGQDPRNRSEVWAVVRALVRGGTTVLLTTHYLEEADRLADRISVIDRGRVIAEGAPDELKAAIGGCQVDLVVRDPDDLDAAAELLARVSGAAPELDARGAADERAGARQRRLARRAAAGAGGPRDRGRGRRPAAARRSTRSSSTSPAPRRGGGGMIWALATAGRSPAAT